MRDGRTRVHMERVKRTDEVMGEAQDACEDGGEGRSAGGGRGWGWRTGGGGDGAVAVVDGVAPDK